MLKKTLMLICGYFFLLGGVVNCYSYEELMVIDKETQVLENPYPLNYPSTKPMPNKVITILQKGEEVRIIKYNYGKDYLVYKIQLKNGAIGYVIYNKDFFRIVKSSR